MNDVVWIVCEESHGMVSIWESKGLAKLEVNRILAEVYPEANDKPCEDGWYYGNEFVYTYSYKLNMPW